jgi:hypothetical protein
LEGFEEGGEGDVEGQRGRGFFVVGVGGRGWKGRWVEVVCGEEGLVEEG